MRSFCSYIGNNPELVIIMAIGSKPRCLTLILERGGSVVITADHGNSEMLWDQRNDQPHTAHTLNPVPIVFCSNQLIGAPLRERGILADVAPSLLDILELQPSEGMDGVSLLRP